MLARHELTRRAAIGSLLLALAGCGGGVPTTGETVHNKPDEATKKKSLEEYMKRSMKGKQAKTGPSEAKP